MAESSFNPEIKPDQKYTYADYLTWPEDERWEIIDGKAYAQATPSWRHQSISVELSTQFQLYFPCARFKTTGFQPVSFQLDW